jgi:glyoxylase-like metal-dependent hydrolase (beta-lactamase superfamily II)
MTWHTTTRIAEHVYLITEPFGAIEPRVGVETANMYLVLGQERAALVDSGLGVGDVRAKVGEITSLPCTVLNTHYHWDHCGANARFDETAIHEIEFDLVAQEQNLSWMRRAMAAPSARAVLPPGFDPAAYRVVPKQATRTLHDGDRIDLGGRVLQVLHVPGHSPGHVAYLDREGGMLFTGDTAYVGPVYACFQGSDPAAFVESVKRLAALPGVTAVCPGHNDLIADPGWLGELAECVEAARTGAVPGEAQTGLFRGIAYRFGDLSVWLPE